MTNFIKAHTQKLDKKLVDTQLHNVRKMGRWHSLLVIHFHSYKITLIKLSNLVDCTMIYL